MRTRRFLLTIAVSSALLGIGGLAAQSTSQTSPRREPTSINLKLYAVKWKDVRVISSKIPGRIEERFVNEGDEVSAEQELARLDDRDAILEHAIQEQSLAASELAVPIQEGKLKEYVTRQEAANRLINSRAISLEDFRLAYVNVSVNELLLRQEAVKSVAEKKKHERTGVMVDDHLIKSPVSGIVQQCYKRARESVTAQELQLFRIVVPDRVWVEGFVEEKDLFRTRKGQKVRVQPVFFESAESGANKIVELPESSEVFEGTVVFVDTDVDQTNNVFKVRGEVANRRNGFGDWILRDGVMASVTILRDDPVTETKR